MKAFRFSSLLFLLYFITSVLDLSAQVLEPVKWKFTIQEVGNGLYDLVAEAQIDEHWHLYTQKTYEEGPIATTFTFEKTDGVELMGSIKESESITKYEEIWEAEITFFENRARFTQRVKKLTASEVTVAGYLEFMTCDDKRCLPPEFVDFEFLLPSQKLIETSKNEQTQVLENTEALVSMSGEEEGILEPVSWTFTVEKKEKGIYTLVMKASIEEHWHVYARELSNDDGPIPTEISIQKVPGITLIGEVRDEGNKLTEFDQNFMMDLSYYEKEVTFLQDFELSEGQAVIKGSVYFMVCDNKRCLLPEEIEFEVEVDEDASALASTDNKSSISGISFWATFIKGFLGGFLALLTPCVFPMIPLTVSFFTKQSKTRAKGISNALIYSVSIMAIYVLLGYGVTVVFGADALNALSTNVWFNLAFFLILVVFAISFFGAFEITLPSSWVNKADSASDKGGILGIFFMAFTLSLVSFSCTGPIIGTLLVDAAVNGGITGPLIGMFGFSLALALPFGLFAAFPGWLNTLPSSGGWLNSVKVVLGFIELAFAFKFLSNADLVVQAGLLKREVFIAIWIAIFALLTMYLLGIYSLPHDSKSDRISVTRLVAAVFTLMFTIYLIPGIWGAPLKLISGFPPPMFYSESPQGLGGTTMIQAAGSEGEIVGDPEHCPHGLNCFHDYEEGLAYAQKVGKPVMLDFTGWACVNCRKMEEQVWSDPSILKILREEVVLISLYVDEKIALPESEQKEVMIGDKKKKIRTVGNKWSYLQADRYNTNSQPYYVILDHDEVTMNGSAAYDPDIPKFKSWLEEGISRFREGNLAKNN
ncbi:MAG: protein-disulfide reductase DsbD family protein [Vicingaceae bacterium]